MFVVNRPILVNRTVKKNVDSFQFNATHFGQKIPIKEQITALKTS